MIDKIPVCVCPFCGKNLSESKNQPSWFLCVTSGCIMLGVTHHVDTWQNAFAWKLARELLDEVKSRHRHSCPIPDEACMTCRLVNKSEKALGEK